MYENITWSYFGNIRILSKQVHKQNIKCAFSVKVCGHFFPTFEVPFIKKKEAGTKNVRGRQLSVSKRAPG